MNTDTETLAASFREDGFVLVSEFLSRPEIAELDRQLERYIAEVVPKIAPEHVFYESGRSGAIKHLSVPDQYDDYFKGLLERPATLELVAASVGDDVEPIASEVFYKPAHVGSAAPYHQDNAFLHLEPAAGAVVWIAVDDTTVANGAVHYARGSQRLGDLSHFETDVELFSKGLSSIPDLDSYPEVPAILRRGDASIHDFLCAHRSGPNKTAQHRRGLVLNYKSVNATVNEAQAAAHRKYIERFTPPG
ncbi:MAG: phytanoyl-CoA dioxygenase family protein [Lentisphaeria bacterium]|jgi:ectoine hydroxylase-related dioxygenase (phytanoyl-CoA dioxygenase family)|nr:phytanoyl-CoA dioxygenase family protein [Lentisphaeria bacterium]